MEKNHCHHKPNSLRREVVVGKKRRENVREGKKDNGSVRQRDRERETGPSVRVVTSVCLFVS